MSSSASSKSDDSLLVEDRDHTVVLTMNRPARRNAGAWARGG